MGVKLLHSYISMSVNVQGHSELFPLSRSSLFIPPLTILSSTFWNNKVPWVNLLWTWWTYCTFLSQFTMSFIKKSRCANFVEPLKSDIKCTNVDSHEEETITHNNCSHIFKIHSYKSICPDSQTYAKDYLCYIPKRYYRCYTTLNTAYNKRKG